jgi:signal transduction histidine kinase/ActR/RegA family two-component response regulator
VSKLLRALFTNGPFMPHGHCYLWTPGLLWLHVVSDALIVFAYYSIPITLIYFVRKRADMRFGWMFICFAVFIIACGTTHLMEIWNVWHANYWLSGVIKAITALASVPTAYLLTQLVAPALRLPSTADLERLNLALEQEVVTRGAAEESVRRFNLELEKRVEERAAELRKISAERERLLASERAAREEAERIGQLKDEFLSTLSHELRTPLNAVLGWAQILSSEEASPDDLQQGLATIERNARAQKQIIDDLLDMSSIISGKVRMDVQQTDLALILEAAIETLRPAVDAKGIRLQVALDPQARPVSGDSGRLRQVFWNLLSNAVKFTPKGGRVEVRLDQVESHLQVSVIDSGEGISTEFLPHVFERFRQEDASIGRHHGGLGLGLSIAKHLVELHGGTVSVRSAGANQGTTVTVDLPLLAVHSEEELNGESQEPAAGSILEAAERDRSLAGVKVLVVDDETDARVLVRRVLEKGGAQVRTAGSAAEALLAMKAERPDVLVSDIGMPGENGYEFIRQVRELGRDQGGDTPALALTAYARPEDCQKALQAGFQIHIAKPVEAAELLTVVGNLAAADVAPS